MQYRQLGKTGLQVSMVSLGTGGHSRIGMGTGQTPDTSISIVQKAIDEGINLIDSSEMYGTEDLVGQALSGVSRSKYVLSTKAGIHIDSGRKTAPQLKASLEASLKRLRTDYVDIYHMHGISESDYSYVREELVPAMIELRQQGKIRHIGITERFAMDPGHRMLQRAVLDDCWEVMMVGFNLLNQSARSRVLQPAAEKGIGIMDMFAVRKAMISQSALAVFMKSLAGQGLIDPDRFDEQNPLGFLLDQDEYESLTELAYRFCISEPGIHSILSGTGNPQHLEQNLRDIGKGPMPAGDREALMSLFERVDSVSGN